MSTTIPQHIATTVATTDGAVANTSPLQFDLNTNPDPVQVSPSSGDMRTADFVLVGSRRSASAIECRKITLTVPTGTNSPDLTPDLNSATAQISLPGWTPATNTTTKTITFTPISGHAEIGRDQGVTVQLMGVRINTVVGSAPLRIDLEWREAGYDDPWETGTVVFDIGKFPVDFHLANFMAEPLIIDNNGSVKLDWEASGVSSLKLLYDAAEINVLDLATYPVNNVTHTTVFYLRATVQVGTNTVERTLSTTVTVRLPHLEVGNLIVFGDLAMGGTPSGAPKVSASIAANPQHPVENMLDDNLETYYQGNSTIVANDYVMFDFGIVQQIDSIHGYFGSPDGANLPGVALTVEGSVDGERWTSAASVTGGVREIHKSPSRVVQARFVRLRALATPLQPYRYTIRSFQVLWVSPLRVTRDAASFEVPVTAHKGITES